MLMNWNEELKHWSANDDLGISRYRAFQLTKNQVHPGSLSFRIIERRAAHRNGAVSRSRPLFTAHKSNMSAFDGPSAIMTFGKALPQAWRKTRCPGESARAACVAFLGWLPPWHHAPR